MRPRATPLAVVLAAVALAGCATAQQTASSPASGTAATSSTRHGVAVGQERVLSRFAGAYLRFLDGDLDAAQLPDTTAVARRQAVQGGQLPAAKRAGRLVLVNIAPAQGAIGGWFFAGRDRQHTFPAGATLVRSRDRWVIVDILTPDWTQDLTPPAPPAPPPAGSTAAVSAARRFLVAYLPWQYGHGTLAAIRGASSSLTATLRRNAPNIPPAMARQPTGRVLALTPVHHGRGWNVYATIADTATTYSLIVTVQPARGGWVVTHIGGLDQ